MKKKYMMPITRVIALSQQQHMLAGSVPVSDTETTTQFAREFGFGFDDWDEDEE